MNYGYARISTITQSLHSQEQALSRSGCDEIYHDVASGAKAKRTGLTALERKLRPNDTITVVSLDRLGRSLPDLINRISAYSDMQVRFVSLKESIDTSTPAGKLMLHIFAALAEFERERIRERTAAGLKAARARGRVGGRPRVITDDMLKRAIELKEDKSLSIPQIARLLGVGKSTLYRALDEKRL